MQVKFGAIVTSGSGKIGGQFISGDRSGSSLRTKNFKAKNSQVNTISQRGIVAMMSRAWRELTEAQRQLWRSYAATQYSKSFSYGAASLSGFQTFMQVNCSFYVDGDSIIAQPQTMLSALPVTIESFVKASTTPVFSKFDEILGGYFICLLPSTDPLYDPAVPKALIAAKNFVTSAKAYQTKDFGRWYSSGRKIGSSLSNSAILISKGVTLSPLVFECIAYNGGGFSDWVFPSIDAMSSIIAEPTLDMYLAFNRMWSSTEENEFAAVSINPVYKAMYSDFKADSYVTIPIRISAVPALPSLCINLSAELSGTLAVKVSVTKPVSVGISNPRNTFTDLGIFTSSVDNKIDITAAYIAKFGSLSGMSGKIFIKAFVFDSVTKQRSNAFISSTTLF